MIDAQKPDRVSLNTLIGYLREGRYVIPNFQREFEWTPAQICELMRSIFRDYYIGSLLLWKGNEENFNALSCEPIYCFEGKNEQRDYIVLDGQQRLTAMYYAFFAPDIPLPRRKSAAVYFMHVDKFTNEEYDEAFSYEWHSRHIANILEDRESQFAKHIFPLRTVGESSVGFVHWIRDYQEYWKNKAATAEGQDNQKESSDNEKKAIAFGERLQKIVLNYQISYIELNQKLELTKICDIFTQINSQGTRLDVFDLMNALLAPKHIKLKEMWRSARSRLEFSDFGKMNVNILQVMSILKQKSCSPSHLYYLMPGQKKQFRGPDGTLTKKVLVADVEEFKTCWDQSVDALENTINLLRDPREYGAISPSYLPYTTILPVFSALQIYAKELKPEMRLKAQQKIKHWYWASVFTGRYSKSVDSTTARDFVDVTAWIETEDNTDKPAPVQEFKNSFRSMDLHSETVRGTALYKGIFNLLVLRGARDWISGTFPQPNDLDDHHIVPKSWGNKNLASDKVNTILNRTPLTAETNREVIRDKLPNEYLLNWINKNGKQPVLEILETHLISAAALEILLRVPFTSDDFGDFITERQRTIKDAIEALLIKERLGLEPRLRELDEAIEKIELELRQIVSQGLNSDSSRLPHHILEKINERLRRAARKNAAFDLGHYESLINKLEYCDLRELQDVILAKNSWSAFEAQFVNKETLASRFNQLAELRNAIRHSRTADDVTRKDGEAAVLWFKKVINI